MRGEATYLEHVQGQLLRLERAPVGCGSNAGGSNIRETCGQGTLVFSWPTASLLAVTSPGCFKSEQSCVDGQVVRSSLYALATGRVRSLVPWLRPFIKDLYIKILYEARFVLGASSWFR
eukprot:4601313-Pyramimonas_sp.AAC.1